MDSFKNRTLDEWTTLLDVLRPYYEKLDANDTLDFVSTLTVTSPAHLIFITIRSKFLTEVLTVSNRKMGVEPNGPLDRIRRHLYIYLISFRLREGTIPDTSNGMMNVLGNYSRLSLLQ